MLALLAGPAAASCRCPRHLLLPSTLLALPPPRPCPLPAPQFLVERVRDGRRYALKRTLISELSEGEKWVAVNEVRQGR